MSTITLRPLSADEARVLGVLIEKAFTTPDAYPLSLNALVAGCNQKNNRWPVLELGEDEVFRAAEGLRDTGLVVRVDQYGSRVHKYRHETQGKLSTGHAQTALLAELLLRGPQTLGELRGRASRMQAIETVSQVRELLDPLTKTEGRPQALIRELPPAPGSRAERYAQLMAPDAHDVEAADAAPAPVAAAPAHQGGDPDRVRQLERRVAQLEQAVRSIASQLGIPDPTAEPAETSPPARA